LCQSPRFSLQASAEKTDEEAMDVGAIQAAAAASAASYRSFADATRSVLDLLAQQIPDVTTFLAHLDRPNDVHRIVDTRNGGEFGLRSNLTLPLRESFCVLMVEERGPRLCNDVPAHSVYGPAIAQERFDAASYLGMPIELSDGSRVGSLGALSREHGRFTAEHEQLFAMLARVLAYELERETNERDLRRLNDSLRSQARGLAAVAAAARALAVDGDQRQAICEAAAEAAGAPVAFLLEPQGRELVSTAMHGIDMAPVTIQARDATGPRAAARAFGAMERYFVADARDHPALAQPLVDATSAKSALFEPVMREDQVAGVLILIWREHVAEPTESTTAVLRLVAAQAAAAIEHATLRARLGALALTDPLTGLSTDRMFTEEVPREIARARRSDTPVCLAMIDLDHLGAFNMLRGEREGDRLLKETGALWAGTLREVDTFARLDGGRFGILLPGCALGEAIDVIERVRGLTPRGQTASAGVARWDGEEPAELLIERCRGALDSAKAAGRDITIQAD
jgi:diguanylate cyclase (GGDEF)-like protein